MSLLDPKGTPNTRTLPQPKHDVSRIWAQLRRDYSIPGGQRKLKGGVPWEPVKQISAGQKKSHLLIWSYLRRANGASSHISNRQVNLQAPLVPINLYLLCIPKPLNSHAAPVHRLLSWPYSYLFFIMEERSSSVSLCSREISLSARFLSAPER